MARAPLLQLSDISLTFGGNPVFDGLSLTVQPGDRVALVGRNGSGKSTLMKVMAGLVEADRGARVVPQGVTVGYMEQDPDLSGYTTLGDYAASALPEGESYRLAVVAEGLKFDPETPVATASGGERRRAALAKLLAEAPELMLLDEPTNHLDIHHQLAILDLVAGLGVTTVIALHDMHHALRCDRVMVLRAGRRVALGPPDEVLTPDLIREIFAVEAELIPHPRGGRPVFAFQRIA